MVNTGERLKTLRIENGLTQKQVAERVGVAVSAISSYEGGIRLPSYGVLIKLSKLYHVTTDFLLGAEKRVMLDISELSDSDRAAVNSIVIALREKYK